MSTQSQSVFKAETEARLRFEMLLADVCAQFVNVAASDVDSKIANAQRAICESLRMDHSSVWQVAEENPDLFVMTHVYRDPNLEPLPLRPSAKEYFPWSYKKILNKEVVCVPYTATLPAEAAKDKESWEQYGIHSSLVFPLSVGGGSLIGVLAFDSEKEHDWPEPLQRRLQILAHVFAQALDRKHAEQKVRETENRFRLVADTAPVLIWMSGTDKLCTYFNKPWLEFTGRSMEQELGNGWAEGVHPEDLQRCLDTYSQSFDQREKFRMEYRLRHHDGEFRWILDIGVPRFNEDRSFAGYIGIGVDVTDRKDAQLAVGESEERLRLAAQLGRMFAYSWDAATDVIERSGESAEILGVKKEEAATGAVVSGMVHPDDKERLESALANLTVEKPTLQITYRIVRPDGVVKWLERNSRAYFDGNGTVKRMVGMVVDVTERKQAEQSLADMTRKLIEAQEQERARIGRELHDDINQRLAMLALELEQLQNDPSDVQNHLQELRKRTTEISNDVQALSHDLHSSKLEYLGVVAGIKSWCKDFAERQKIEIDFRSNVQSVLPLEVGRTLFRVLQEALQNSIKHSGVKRIEVQLLEDFGEIHMVVGDLGKGFDLEAALQGRGLGLISMRERVRLVNGTIEIQSRPMGGTTIHVRVPLEAEHGSQRAAG